MKSWSLSQRCVPSSYLCVYFPPPSQNDDSPQDFCRPQLQTSTTENPQTNMTEFISSLWEKLVESGKFEGLVHFILALSTNILFLCFV